jgi:transcription antitermination factor NusG
MLTNTTPLEAPTSESWFALRVKPHFEKLVASVAHNKGFEEFLPLHRSRRRWSDRYQSVELPLFPGYVFCRLDPQYRLPLLTIPGVLHFVGIGKVPAPVDEAEIVAIRTALQAGLGAEPWPFLETGQLVKIEDGPLAGMEGLLVEVRKQQRLVVSVTLLQRSIAVEIERDWAKPLDVRGRKPVQNAFSSLATPSWRLTSASRPLTSASAATCLPVASPNTAATRGQLSRVE